MTLTDSELRSLRHRLSTYTDMQLTATLDSKQLVLSTLVSEIEDPFNDDHPKVVAYEKALCVFNACRDEQDRRAKGASVESLPGMDPTLTRTHTMEGR